MANFDMETLMHAASILITLLGILAFLTSVIVQVVKDLPWTTDVPTDVVVLIIAVFLTFSAGIAAAQIYTVSTKWYIVVALIVLSFCVSFIASHGWSKFGELYDRFKNVKESN